MLSNTSLIAKNTLALYFRQILTMLVSLYTVRVVLNTLGAEDYGIYNVVAGLVVLFSFLNGAMTSATQRFLNYSLGQNDNDQAKEIFSVSFIIHILIAILVIILAETIGLWFFYTWLKIPPNRQTAAFVVYQFSVVVTIVNILRVPYNAVIIAHEKMYFFALVSIIEAVLKLGAVFLLLVISFDSLIVYAFLVCIIAIILFLCHKFYCNNKFDVANFRYCKNKELFRQLAGFSGWSVFGGFANVSSTHGTNMLVNIFYGVTVNAALGIAMQVNSAVFYFVSNFQTAFNPQIIKSYAAKDYDYFMRLIFRTSKISFFLLFFFVLPLYVNMDFVLQLWLKNVPEYTIAFTRLILIFSLADAVSGPLWMSIQATGNIKKYQVIVSCFIFANLPLSFLLLWLGFSPVWVLIIKTGLNILTLIWRIFFLSKRIELSIIDFLRDVIIPVIIIAGISGLITIFLSSYFLNWSALIISCIVSTLCVSSLIYCIGLNSEEKKELQNWVKKYIPKKGNVNGFY